VNRREILIKRIKNLENEDFDDISIELHSYQYEHNEIYKSFCDYSRGKDFRPKSINEIPCLPVSFFKQNKIITGSVESEAIYRSSSTTGSIPSQHFVYDNQLYLEQALQTFEHFYGDIKEWLILALLPGYIERGDSSLIAMSQYFIEKSEHEDGGFFLNDFEKLMQVVSKNTSKKVLLLGVSFALQQLAELKPDFHNVVIMETGGMKGKGKELPKKAFHTFLKNAFNVKHIHSEYGMTELLSQAYSEKDGVFLCGKTMKVITKDITDPFTAVGTGKSGVINVIDLLNIDSCCFIETQDLGITYFNGTFQLLGRVDAAEIRGCNLLVSDI
jgi:hypothetical protein